MRLLDEISEWKLEAKSENTERYFYHVAETGRIVVGSAAYVIGRKGTGKTAIAEYLLRLARYDTFTEKLTFKNFPFVDLYGLKNNSFTPPNQYITFWKYLIYAFVCKMMVRNAALDSEVRGVLERIFAPPALKALEAWITRLVATDFSISVLGSGGKIGLSEAPLSAQSWPDRVGVLEEIIARFAGTAKYYVVFDELDEDYKNMLDKQHYQQYTELLTGLFKAVQDIKSRFRTTNTQILPVIFLRDDIYDVIMDSDKTKWDDFKIDLEWDKERLKRLLAFRITRAGDPLVANPLAFHIAWHHVFVLQPITYGNEQNKTTSIFEYICRNTHLRPRDFIRYMQACAVATSPAYSRINAATVKKVNKAFSNHLKRELVDEIHGVIPEINAVLNVISHLRKQTLSIAEFRAEYDKQVQRGALREKDVNFVLNVLFNFSVIGNQPKQKNATVFRYTNKEAQLNFSENIVVHRGLYRALQIM